MFDSELRKVKSMTSQSVKPSYALSECAAKYAIAIAAPWDPRAVGVCVPKWPAVPSQKARLFQRFSVTCNSTGFAFVYYTPTMANDAPAGWYSDAAFVGSTGAVTTGTTGGTTTTGVTCLKMANAPYTSSQLTPVRNVTLASVRGRVVASAVSVQYTGTVLNEGGMYTMRVDPTHGNLFNYTTAQLQTYSDTKVIPITRRKEWLIDGPAFENETEYATAWFDAGNGTAGQTISQVSPWCNQDLMSASDSTNSYANPAPTNVIYINSTAGNTFQVEVVTHVEYVGTLCTTMLTPSHADNIGFQAVSTAQKQATSTNATGVDAIMDLATAFLASQSSATSAIQAGIVLNAAGKAVKYGIDNQSGMNLRGSAPTPMPKYFIGK